MKQSYSKQRMKNMRVKIVILAVARELYAWTGLESMTLRLPVQYCIHLPLELTGKLSSCEFVLMLIIFPWIL